MMGFLGFILSTVFWVLIVCWICQGLKNYPHKLVEDWETMRNWWYSL